MAKTIQCPNCTKRTDDTNAMMQHIKAKHHGKGIAAFRPASDDDDDSFADRAIAADLDHAMGVDNPDYDWLVGPFK